MEHIFPVRVTRARAGPEPTSRTLYFKVWYGRQGQFFDPGKVPEFDGDEAWFEVSLDHRGKWKFLRVCEKP